MYLQQEDWKKDCNMQKTSSVGFLAHDTFKNYSFHGLKHPYFKTFFLSLALISCLQAENLEEVMEGFDDKATEKKIQSSDNIMDGFDELPISSIKRVSNSRDFTGKLTQQYTYSYNGDSPHNNITSSKTSLLLDYEHKFNNGFKFKTNLKGYYDSIYDIRGVKKYSSQEVDEFKSEIELYDAYLEGSFSDNLDMKLGHQVVVWGRSDTIRITDVLNPLDNRRPGMVDIEDLRLPVAMIKFDYFLGDWRITPIAVAEQKFSKNPPSGSAFNPNLRATPKNKNYSDITPALSIGGEFSGWDINFYASQLHDDGGYFDLDKIKHDRVNMVGSAVNILKGSWLIKSELAHFDGLKYTSAPKKEFKRTDALLGVEYNGIADTLISYDMAVRNIHDYDARLKNESLETKERNYQHAFRLSSDFMNATVKVNYLISLFGSKMNEGGFQRAWVKYDIKDAIYANIGVVDYIGGSNRFDMVSNNDMIFTDISFSF
jgi:hypothetical protein